MVDERLMNYFKFDEADLQANRSGQFTDKQKNLLVKEDKSDKLFNLLGAIILFLIIAVILYVGISGFSQSQDTQGKLTAVILVVTFGGIFTAFGVRSLRRAFANFQVKLLKAEGHINIVKEERNSTRSDGTTSHYFVYEMHIGSGTFEVTSNLAGIMMQGDVYAIYYTQCSENEILSAELLSKAK